MLERCTAERFVRAETPIPMSQSETVELTRRQRQMLLDGLCYVRNSINLHLCDPTPDYLAERDENLKEVASLVDCLNGEPAPNSAAQVGAASE